MEGIRNIELALARWTVPAVDSGHATGGTDTTLNDTRKDWPIDRWVLGQIHIIKANGAEYFRDITANTATQITFAALPGGVVVDTDDIYTVSDPKVLNLIKAQTDKLAGETVVEGTVTANWNTATGTSGEAGEDLLGGASAQPAIGTAATKHKLHSLLLDVTALTDGAKIHVKLFMKVNGNEKKVYDTEFTVPTTAAGETPPPDTLGLWIVNGTVVVHDTLRVEVYSDTSENVAIAFTYVLEAM